MVTGNCLYVQVSTHSFQDSTQKSGRCECKTPGQGPLLSDCGALKLHDQQSPGFFLVSSGLEKQQYGGVGLASTPVLLAQHWWLRVAPAVLSARSGIWSTVQWKNPSPQHAWLRKHALMLMLVRRGVQRATLTFGHCPSFKTISLGQFPRNFAVNQLLSFVKTSLQRIGLDKLHLPLTFLICNIRIIIVPIPMDLG